MPLFTMRSSRLRGGDRLRGTPTTTIPAVEPAPTYSTTIVASDTVTAGATSIPVDPLGATLQAGTVLAWSGGTSATLTAAVEIGATSVPVSALAGGVAVAETAVATGSAIRLLEQVVVTVPGPTLGADGWPAGWQPASTTRTAVGRFQVVIGGVDVTFVGGVPTVVEEYTFAEPFGDLHCVLRFPNLPPWTAWPEWMDDSKTVELYLVGLDDVRLSDEAVWEGILEDPEDQVDERTAQTQVTAIGVLWQLCNDYLRLWQTTDAPDDIGALALSQFSLVARPHGKWNEPAAFHVGVQSRRRGGGEKVGDYLQALFPEANDPDKQLTITTVRPRTPKMMWKDVTTVHASMRAGTPGLTYRAPKRWSETVDAAYTEGVDEGGGRHRGYHARDDGTGLVYIVPADADPAVNPYIENADGSVTVDTSALDYSGRRRETLINVGNGVNRDQATRAAAQFRAWRQDPGWVVTGTLVTCPASMWRGRLRDGMNFEIEGHRETNLLVHLAGVRVQVGEQGPVKVDINGSTKALDMPTIADIIARRHELARDPFKRINGDGDDTQTKRGVPWDTQKSGWVPGDSTNGFRWATGTSTVPCVAGVWKTVRFLASEKDSIAFSELHTSPARKFSAVVTDREPDPGKLPLDPFADGAWTSFKTDSTTGYVIHWGQYDSLAQVVEGAGYWPGWESAGNSITGYHQDELTWQFSHENVPAGLRQNAYLWISVFVTGGDAAFWAHFLRGVGY